MCRYSEAIDVDNNFASNAFTAPVAGYYGFSLHLMTGNTVASVVVQVFVDNVSTKHTLHVQGATSFDHGSLPVMILSLAQGAVVNVKTTAATGKIRGTSTEYYTCFSGWLIANS